jgi:L-aspartate oxidase
VLHARDATGREIGNVLWTRVRPCPASGRTRTPGSSIWWWGGRCAGVRFLDEQGRLATARAPAVLLATGGAGQVYSETTNPAVATGDGVAMAWRAGARGGRPRVRAVPPDRALRAGASRASCSRRRCAAKGARLLNAAGEPFMELYDMAGELAPRDRVSRAIAREVLRTGQPVFLSLEHLDPDFVHGRFPLISDACRRAGLDLARDRCRSARPRTTSWAASRPISTGRRASRGCTPPARPPARACTAPTASPATRCSRGSCSARGRVGRCARGRAGGRRIAEAAAGAPSPLTSPGATAEEIQRLMWRDVGLFRDRDGLARAVEALDAACTRVDAQMREGRTFDAEGWRTVSILTVGRLIARAALRREESRGGHYRTDFPERDDIHWATGHRFIGPSVHRSIESEGPYVGC